MMQGIKAHGGGGEEGGGNSSTAAESTTTTELQLFFSEKIWTLVLKVVFDNVHKQSVPHKGCHSPLQVVIIYVTE